MKITIRIYRSHDFDLMALCQAESVAFAQAVKQAIIAYYCGEQFHYEVRKTRPVDPKTMPLVMTFTLDISDFDEPGIERWLSGISKGSRNCCFKAIFRHYLADPCMAFFREDETATPVEEVEQAPVAMPRNFRRSRKREMTGREWVDAVANGSINKKKHAPKPRDLDEILKPRENRKETVSYVGASGNERVPSHIEPERTGNATYTSPAHQEISNNSPGMEPVPSDPAYQPQGSYEPAPYMESESSYDENANEGSLDTAPANRYGTADADPYNVGDAGVIGENESGSNDPGLFHDTGIADQKEKHTSREDDAGDEEFDAFAAFESMM